ncbi:hypothetical protein COU60_01845 [Candidatus Pacearchaeota archaeon CG10_big_fil_rev_8_21_14_0_10_34_76]|nr:MAG: hypothetical protein COU60_01845 [Candidatus Pacearchaeota archaeon CG10_big_fil_rev_8_21_14_0_10_34_76]
MKKRLTFAFTVIVVALFSIGFVVAQRDPFAGVRSGSGSGSGSSGTIGTAIGGIADIVNSIIVALEPFIALLVGATPGGELLFAKLLVIIMLVAIIWVVMGSFPLFADKRGLSALVSIVVALLAVRFITEDTIINAVLLPYSALGISISVLIPFAIYFYFVENVLTQKILRNFAWVFAAAVFIGLYVVRFDQVGDFAWVYFAAAGGSIALLMLDGTIQKAFRKARYDQIRALQGAQMQSDILTKRQELETKFVDGTITPAAYKIQDKHLKKLERKWVS